MSNITTVEAKLPPGFRFHPKDEELVCDYLLSKVTHRNSHSLLLLGEVDLNKCEPWDIPETACVGGKEWYFYTRRDRKYATGLRTNRATASGYWKATGKDRPILEQGRTLVGMRKTLVFYQGRAPKGTKTDWVMHEFRLDGPLISPPNIISSHYTEDWVLCRVFHKSREGPSKPNMGNYFEDDASSSTLPALLDTFINFDHCQTIMDDYEQVPCFSIFSDHQTVPILPHNNITTHQMEPIISLKEFEQQLPLNPPFHLDDFSCDQKIKAVLHHLSKAPQQSIITSYDHQSSVEE